MKSIFILFAIAATPICFAQPVEFSKRELIAAIKMTNGDNPILLSENARLLHINDSLHLDTASPIGNKKTKTTFLLRFANDIDVVAAQKVYFDTGQFDYVEPNYIGYGHGVAQTTPNDAWYSSRQWSHFNNGTFTLSPSSVDADIDTDLAWDITQGDPDLIVAVLDSGVRLTHPEFAGRIFPGYDFVNNDSDPTDDHGHGTNVAGVAMAKGNNAVGYAGVNWNSKLMACKVLNSKNSGFYSWWADAIYFAVDNGAKVINLSAGGSSSSSLLENAVNYAYANNVSVVVSTGNQNGSIQYPAKYTNAIAVGSTNSNDNRTSPFFWSTTSGSNFGPELDFIAPGNYIYGLSYNSDTNYNSYWGGTSQSAPHVTGVISLLLSINPTLTVSEIRLILQQSSQDQVGDAFDTTGWDPYYGFGRINAFNAVSNPLMLSTPYFVQSKNIIIFPNPIAGNQNFSVTGLDSGAMYVFQILAMDGKLIRTFNHALSKEIQIEAETLQTGIYILKITNTSSKLIFTKKFVKN